MALAAANSKLFARASLIMVGLMFVLPFLQPYHYFPISSFYSEWAAFALGLAAATLLIMKRHSTNLPVPVVGIAPLGLVVLFAVQVALDRVPYPEQAMTAAYYLVWATILLMLGATLRREFEFRDFAVVLSWSLVIGGVFSALAGMLQHYSVREPFEQLIAPKISGGVYGNLGQTNSFANYSALALSALAYLFALRKVSCVFSGAAAVLMVYTLALSGSRTSWLYLILIVALSAMGHVAGRDVPGKRLLGFALGLFAGFLAAHWVATLPVLQPTEAVDAVTSGGRLFDALSSITTEGRQVTNPDIAERVQYLQEAWWMFLGSPLLGVGFGHYAWHHFEFMAQTGMVAASRLVNHSHNIVFQLLAETGMTGVLIVLGPVLAWIVGLRRLRWSLELWWLLALLGVIGIHSLLEFPLWYSFFLGIAAIGLGFGASHSFTIRLPWAGPIVVSVVLAFSWVHAVTTLHSYRTFERFAFSMSTERVVRGGEGLAETLTPLHREPVIKPYVELAMSFWLTISEEHLREKLDLNSRAMRFAPMGSVLCRQAFLLAMNGRREEALQLLERAIRVFPEELGDVIMVLTRLSGIYPDRFSPLLDVAVSSITYP